MHAILQGLFACAILIALPAEATDDLAYLSLEELMDIEVSLQSRKPRPISESTAAVALITSDNLRRSGVRSLSEALRLVPGLQVGAEVRGVANVSLDVYRAIPCGLIINELVSNAFKYAFPKGNHGTISVHLHRVGDGRLELTVSDDGAGIPPDLDLEEPSMLGLQLVSTLVGQLKGSIDLDRSAGTRISIVFEDRWNPES